MTISLNYFFRIKENELNQINAFSCSSEHVLVGEPEIQKLEKSGRKVAEF